MKKLLYKTWAWAKPYFTWKMAPCLLIAWMITNGWAYIFVALGAKLSIAWMTYIGSAWIAILWMPWTPEKFLVTAPLAVLIYRIIYRQKFIKNEKENKDAIKD